ncbi:MAG: radical SAM protein [Myxococcota bacterium]
MYDVGRIIAEPELLAPLRRAVDGEAPAYLRSVKIKLTARCNLKCKMCRYGRGEKPPELATERWLTIIDELAALGCRKIHWSGGEVMMRRDLEVLMARARARRMKVTLTSNLTLLTKDRAKAIMKLRPSGLSTSLDGARAKTHDRVRGIEGSHKRTLRALRRLERYRRDHRPRTRINFVMMRENMHEYPAVVDLAAAHGAIDVIPMPVDSSQRALRLNKPLIRRYEEQVAPLVEARRRAAGFSLDPQRIHPFGAHGTFQAAARGHYAGGYYERKACYAPYLHMFVAWNGHVFLCCMTNGRIDPLGDLSHQSVAEVFRGARFAAIRARMAHRRLPSCHRCDMYTDENRRLAEVLPQPAAPRTTGSSPRRLPLIAS